MRDIEYLIQSLFGSFGLVSFIFFILIPLIRSLRGMSIYSRAFGQGGRSVEGASVPIAEYYKTLMERFKEREIKGLRTYIDSLDEGMPGGSFRKYLKVQKGDIIFYVSTFHLGSSQVFTYWQVYPVAFLRRMITNIPFIGKALIALFYSKTLYRDDVAAAIRGMIDQDIKDITNQIEGSQGVRDIAQPDMQALVRSGSPQ